MKKHNEMKFHIVRREKFYILKAIVHFIEKKFNSSTIMTNSRSTNVLHNIVEIKEGMFIKLYSRNIN